MTPLRNGKRNIGQPAPLRPPVWTATGWVRTLTPLEAVRAACPHQGGWYYDSQSGQTCATCGAAHPGSWTAECLRGWQG